MKNKLTRLNNKPLVLSLAFGLIAATIITVSLAASPNASLEPEDSSNSSANVAVRNDSSASNSQYVEFSSTEDEVTETPASWQAAFDSRNQNTIDAWYEENTGYDAAPDGAPDTLMTIPDGAIIDEVWLQSNEDGEHVYQQGNRWIVDAIKAGEIRIGANNVTLRRALIDRTGSLWAIANHPTSNSGITGTVVEYCTVKGNDHKQVGIKLSPPQQTTDEAIVRYCDVYGVKGGVQMYGGETYEYNYIHDLYYFTGSHNTSASNRGSNVRVRRNMMDDGSSAAFALYAESRLVHNVVIEENIFNTDNAYYCVSYPDKAYVADSYDTHLTNNIFGQRYNPKCGWSSPVARGYNFTTATGNVYMDGNPI